MMKKSILKLGITGLALSITLLSGTAIATAKAPIDSMQIAPDTFSFLKDLFVMDTRLQLNLTNNVVDKKQENKVMPKPESVEIKTPKTAPTVKQQAPKQKIIKAAASSPRTNKKISIIQSTSNPKHTIEVSPGNSVRYSRLVTAKATAYTAAAEENGIWGAYDYYGDPLKLGTIAVDPDVIPMGSKVYITGYRFDGLPDKGMIAIATDQGSSIQGKRVDIFVPTSKADGSKFGMQDVKVYIIE
jgi:3D (Asp-Asp-Asp) domain-containing protein